MTQDTLRDAVVAAGGKPFNARQLAQWLYEKREPELARMTNLPKTFASNLPHRTPRSPAACSPPRTAVKAQPNSH